MSPASSDAAANLELTARLISPQKRILKHIFCHEFITLFQSAEDDIPDMRVAGAPQRRRRKNCKVQTGRCDVVREEFLEVVRILPETVGVPDAVIPEVAAPTRRFPVSLLREIIRLQTPREHSLDITFVSRVIGFS